MATTIPFSMAEYRRAALLRLSQDRDAVRAAYRAWFVGQATAHGVPAAYLGFYVKDSLADMNVTGILRYLDKRAQAPA